MKPSHPHHHSPNIPQKATMENRRMSCPSCAKACVTPQPRIGSPRNVHHVHLLPISLAQHTRQAFFFLLSHPSSCFKQARDPFSLCFFGYLSTYVLHLPVGGGAHATDGEKRRGGDLLFFLLERFHGRIFFTTNTSVCLHTEGVTNRAASARVSSAELELSLSY